LFKVGHLIGRRLLCTLGCICVLGCLSSLADAQQKKGFPKSGRIADGHEHHSHGGARINVAAVEILVCLTFLISPWTIRSRRPSAQMATLCYTHQWL